MKLLDAFRTATFRVSALASAAFAALALALYGFVFWQTTGYERRRIDVFLRNEATAIMRKPPEEIAPDVTGRFAADLHRLTFAAVFAPRTEGGSADGTGGGAGGGMQVIAGGLRGFPAKLPVDGAVHRVTAERQGAGEEGLEPVRALADRLADGRVIVVGRSDQDLDELNRVVWRALELSLATGILLALLAGAYASLRVTARVSALNQAIGRIMAGRIGERLPARGGSDALDQLATSVNRMLDEIGRLIGEIQSVGDNIAHDLRTPLQRVRSRLEGGRSRAGTREELALVVDRAIGDLDQTFAMVTAMLRIGQIETGARRAGFRKLDLGEVVQEAAELYQPLAELKSLAFDVSAPPSRPVFGDRELLFEVVANLLDNAVKFAPDGGLVRLGLVAGPECETVRVQGDGPGIAPEDREAAMRGLHRTARGGAGQGNGLGLSIVGAILRLHGYEMRMSDQDGLFTVDVCCTPCSPTQSDRQAT